MKKILIIGAIALVVVGCVLAAGCTSSSTVSSSQSDVITVANDEEFHNALASSGNKTILVSYNLDLNNYNKKYFSDFKQDGLVTQKEDSTAILNTNNHKIIIGAGKTLSPHGHMITDDGTFKNTEGSHNKEILSFLGDVSLDSDSTKINEVYENLLTGGKNVRTGDGLGIVNITFKYNDGLLRSSNLPGGESSTFLPKGSTEKIIIVTDTSKTNGLKVSDTLTAPEGTTMKVSGNIGHDGIYTILEGNIEINNYNDSIKASVPKNVALIFGKNSKVTLSEGTDFTVLDKSVLVNNGVITVKKNGLFTLDDGSLFTNNGEFTVEEGAKYTQHKLAEMINNGKVSGI